MKWRDSSTLSHTVSYRTEPNAPCRNRTYNLMIKSQIRAHELAPISRLHIVAASPVSVTAVGRIAPEASTLSHTPHSSQVRRIVSSEFMRGASVSSCIDTLNICAQIAMPDFPLLRTPSTPLRESQAGASNKEGTSK